VSEPGSRARLFAALDLPEAVRAELSRWARDEAGGMDGLRLLAPESFHVTLAFLGWRDVADAPRIGELVASCAGPVPGLSLGAAAWFAPRRPRVLAADVVDGEGALGALEQRVSAALAAGAAYEPEHRPYHPHVTIARVRGGARVRAVELAPPAPLEFEGAAVTLYRSHTGPGGARYQALSRTAI
jgi:2'-5' RNA ligase